MPLSASAEKALRDAVKSGKITQAQADQSRAIASRNDAIRAGERKGMDGSAAQVRTPSNKSSSNNTSSNKTTSSKSTNNLQNNNPYNEHQSYLEKTYDGGYKAYVDNQNKRYQSAIQNNNNDLAKRLLADAERVGYDLRMSEQPTNMNDVLNQYLQQITTPYQQPQIQQPTLSYNQALQQSENRLNPLYDQAMKELERKLAIDAERSGLDTSQLGNKRLEDRLENFIAQKQSAINQTAQDLQNKSAEEARYAEEQAYRQHQGNIQNLLAGLGMMNTMKQQNIQNQQWQQQFGLDKDLAIANLTGNYNGDPILKKVLADRQYQLGLANTNFDNAMARANLTLKQDMFDWEKEYKENRDDKDADAKAKEIAAKLATGNNGYFDQDTYDKIYTSFTGKNALNDPFVKSILEMFMKFGTGAGIPKNNYDEQALKDAGLIN